VTEPGIVDQAMVARLFHAEWYAAAYPDVAGQDPLQHFRQSGAGEERDPNPMFSTAWYLQRYPDAAGSGVNALEDYVSRGAALGRDPGPLFSTTWYLASNPDVAAAGLNPLEHYLSWGPKQRRDPSPVFDSAWYFAAYPDADAPDVDARVHYLQQGARLGYDPCPLFNTRWYLDRYPGEVPEGEAALVHYLTQGAAQGFDPSPHFSTSAYLERHPEVAAAGENALVHCLAHDLERGRSFMQATAGHLGPVSRAALAEVRDVISAFADIEPDLAALPEALEAIHAVPLRPDRGMSAWRGLYLSLHVPPRRLVLVGSIDDAPELAGLAIRPDGLLIVETDAASVSTAEALPRFMPWRSLSEFGADLDAEDRVKIVTALVNGLLPAAVLVWGSRAGWEMLHRHGAAMRHNTALFAVAAASPELSAAHLLRGYFRSCIPSLSALYGHDLPDLHRTASLFGLPPGEHGKLRRLQPGDDLDGLLSPPEIGQ